MQSAQSRFGNNLTNTSIVSSFENLRSKTRAAFRVFAGHAVGAALNTGRANKFVPA